MLLVKQLWGKYFHVVARSFYSILKTSHALNSKNNNRIILFIIKDKRYGKDDFLKSNYDKNLTPKYSLNFKNMEPSIEIKNNKLMITKGR
jgi:hypothetical protein